MHWSSINFKKTNRTLLLKLLLLVLLVAFLLTPFVHYKIGNVFFGGVEKLYNVNLAQHFFKYSSYPLIGNAPPYSHYQLSRTHFIKGDFNEAVVEARKELEFYPEHVRTYYILGLTYGYMNREIEAIDSFSRFIDKNPESWAARNDKAWLQFRIGKIDDAIETITPVTNMANPWVQNTYGTLLLNNGKLTEAKEAFLYALDLVSKMRNEDWGRAYPGNDPRIYSTGLNAMKISIESNLEIVEDLLLVESAS